MMGMPFEGHGIMGFDKMLKKFTFTWIDSMGTMTMSGMGDGDLIKRIINTSSEYLDPFSGMQSKMRSEYLIPSDKEHTLNMYGYGPDGNKSF